MASRLRLALGVTGALLLGLVGLVAWVGADFVGLSDRDDGAALGARTTLVADGYVSVFLIDVGGGKFALVDAGNDPKGAAIDAALTKKGVGRDAVVAILLTHSHPDHVAACGGFPNATVYAGKPEGPLLAGTAAPSGPLPRLFGAKAAPCPTPTLVADGQVLTIGDQTATAWVIPGHTVGSTAWTVAGVMFVGDAASATTDGGLTTAPWLFSDDLALDRKSVAGLVAHLDGVTVIAPAHTGPAGPDALRRFAAR